MHHMDVNQTYGEKAWLQLQKNAASIIEQFLEAAPHKASAVLPPSKTIKVRRNTHARHYWRRGDRLISDIVLWTPLHGRAKAGRPAWTYIHQLCADTGYSLKNLPGVMDNRDGWREKAREIHASVMTWWWYYLPTPLLGQDMTQGQFLSGV